MSPQCQKCAKKKTKCFFPNHEMCHVCVVKMRIAPCGVEMFCPKCGLIKENVFSSQPFLDKKQKSKRALLPQKGQILFTTYNAKFLILVFINWAGCCGLSRFEWICRVWQKTKYSFYISIIIDFVTLSLAKHQNNDRKYTRERKSVQRVVHFFFGLQRNTHTKKAKEKKTRIFCSMIESFAPLKLTSLCWERGTAISLGKHGRHL